MVLRVLKEVLWIQTAAMPMLPSQKSEHPSSQSRPARRPPEKVDGNAFLVIKPRPEVVTFAIFMPCVDAKGA
jgi:hypothetical protein